MREQNLRTANAVFPQLRLIHLDQTHLPHRRRRLQLVDGFRATGPTQAFHALGNRAAADHDDLTPVLDQGCQLLTPLANGHGIQATPFIGDQARADLDHDAFGMAKDVGVGYFLHGQSIGSSSAVFTHLSVSFRSTGEWIFG